LKERLEGRKKIQTVVNNVDGGVSEATRNLTMITKDTSDEVSEIKFQLERALDEKVECERKLR
jgi:hypothetical protein